MGIKEKSSGRGGKQSTSETNALTNEKEKNSNFFNLRLPLFHELQSGPTNHPVFLSQVTYPSALPPHFHNLPYFPSSEHHLQGFSAFCEYYSALLIHTIFQMEIIIAIDRFNYYRNLFDIALLA